MTAPHPHPPIVVMGVSAVGKSTVARALAERSGAVFRDADDLHPEANVAKMRAGIPLNDDDRWPWLELVGKALQPGVVMACSALRRSYRDALRAHAPEAFFVHLHADRDTLVARAAAREGHFMPPALLDSQLATLEHLGEEELGAVIDVDATPEDVVTRAVDSIQNGAVQ